ncbi:MAG: carboxypeptidase regulatory-like domain-containing protein [Acidobacteriota bacterium]
MRRVLGSLVCVGIVLAAPWWVGAQTTTTGQIEGEIVDPTGAVVAGANVTLGSAAGLRRERASDAQGRYLFTLLPPGVYQLTVSASGFKLVTVENIVVKITGTTVVNVPLQLARAREEVVVTAAPPLIRSDSPTTGQVIEETTIRQLPLPTRNFQQLLTLTTGTSSSVVNSSELGRGDTTFNVNGQRTTSNSMVINGIDANSIGTGSTPNLSVPATDTLQEFIVQTSLYDASQGRGVGGVVAAVTKSGTNDVHGNAYFFLRNTELNANNFFLNRDGVDKPENNRQQFGFTLGGPIVKERAWFFASYQGTREDNATSLLNSLTTVFVPGNLTDNRSSAALTALSLSCGGFGLVDPTAAALLQARLPNGNLAIPSAPSPGASCAPVPVSTPSTSTFREDQFNANVDVQLTDSNRLSTRFFLANNPTKQALFSFAGLQNPLQLPGFGADLDINQRLVSIGDTHVFSPTVLNDFRFGYSYVRVASTPEEPFTAAQFGINSPLGSQFPGLPTISVSNFFDIGSSPFADNDSNVQTYTLADTVSWTRGRHTLKFGAEYKRNEVNLLFNVYTRGQIFHLGLLFGNPFADFLASGFSDLSIIGSGLNSRNIRSNDFSWFIQDDWRVNDRFALNLGLRYDYYGPFSDTRGRIVAFDPALATTTPILGGVAITGGFVQAGNAEAPLPGIPQGQDSLLDDDRNNFAPRIGFAFQPFARTDQVVVRGGYGIYYDRSNARFINNQVLSFPYYSLALVFLTAETNPFVQVPLPSAFPLDVTDPALFPFGGPPALLPAASLFGPVTLVPSNGIYPDRNNFRTPYVQQYNLGIQYEFIRNWMLDVGYVGSTGRKLTQLVSANQAIAPGAVFPLGPGGPLTPGLSDLAVQGFGIHLMQTSANSSYNSLQLSLTKRYSSGLQFLLSYTYSHSLDDYSGSPTGVSDVSVVPGDQVNLDNRASSDFDRRHRFVFSYLYDFPHFYRGDSAAAKLVLNDWQVAGIITLQSGTPFSILTGATAFVQARADFAPGCTAASASFSGSVDDRLDEFFDTSCFVPATGLGNFGGTGRNILRGPDQRNVDFSIVKFFPLNETKRIEFRTEFFNIFNTPSFANPVSDISSGNRGQIVRTSTGPRVIQFALKFSF